jgi:hypothetical protein
MSGDKKTTNAPVKQSGTNADEWVTALLREIQQEMDDLTPKELEHLYAAIILMKLKQDE